LPSVMRGDRKLLFALFSNLLSNALKYSAPGDLVEVTAYRDSGENIAVRIRDRGIGIPERDRGHLFERYFRGVNAVGVAGSGVGLHLVAMVLELHAGTIEVDSSEGVGSTFIVHLPAPAPAAAANAAGRLKLGAA
jgi:two-component system, OmpR family, sensor kinase